MDLQIPSTLPLASFPSSPAPKSPRAARTMPNFRSSPKSRKLDKGKSRARSPSPIADLPPPFLDLEAEAISKAGTNRRKGIDRWVGVGPSGIGGSKGGWAGSDPVKDVENSLGIIQNTTPKEIEQSISITD